MPDHVGRDVVEDAAVDQHLAVEGAPARTRPGWPSSTRRACASQPAVEDHRFGGAEVGGHAAERCRQVVEVGVAAVGRRDAVQEQCDLLARAQAARQLESALQPETQLGRKRARVFLAPEGLVDERRVGAEDGAQSSESTSARISPATCPSRTRRQSGRPCWCRRPRPPGCGARRTTAARRCGRSRGRCRRRGRGRCAAAGGWALRRVAGAWADAGAARPPPASATIHDAPRRRAGVRHRSMRAQSTAKRIQSGVPRTFSARDGACSCAAMHLLGLADACSSWPAAGHHDGDQRRRGPCGSRFSGTVVEGVVVRADRGADGGLARRLATAPPAAASRRSQTARGRARLPGGGGIPGRRPRAHEVVADARSTVAPYPLGTKVDVVYPAGQRPSGRGSGPNCPTSGRRPACC